MLNFNQSDYGIFLSKAVTQILDRSISQPSKVTKESVENFVLVKTWHLPLYLTRFLSFFQFLGIAFLGIGLWAWNEKVS